MVDGQLGINHQSPLIHSDQPTERTKTLGINHQSPLIHFEAVKVVRSVAGNQSGSS